MESVYLKRAKSLKIGDNVVNRGVVKDKQSLSNGYTLIRFENDNFYTELPSISIVYLAEL